jgi:hypothetical protein
LISTRGHFKPEIDKKDFEKEYPEKFEEQDESTVASFFVARA